MGSSPVGSTKKKLSQMRQLFSAFEELYEAIRHADRSLRRFAAWDCRGIRRMRPTMCTSTRERALCVCTHVCPRMADCLRAKKKRAFLLSLYCGRWDLNPHGVSTTRSLVLLVCQFRHFRVFLIKLSRMQEMGLEPTLCCHNRHLKPARLPFRHSCEQMLFY